MEGNGTANDIRAILHRAKEARERLRNPPNAVPDAGIDLKRKPAAFSPLVPKPIYVVQISQPEPPPPPPEPLPPPIPPDTPTCFTPKLMATRIVKVVAHYFGVAAEEITGPSRRGYLIMPRQMACYILREVTRKSIPMIGFYLGGRDHSTILYAYKKIQRRIREDHLVATHYSNIMALINADAADTSPAVPAQPQPVMALQLENQKSLSQPEIYVLDKASGTALVDTKTAKFSNYFWPIFGGDYPRPARQEAPRYRQPLEGFVGFVASLADYRERQILAWSSTSVGLP